MVVIFTHFKEANDRIVARLREQQPDFKLLLRELEELKDYFASVLYVLTGYDKQHYKDALERL
jgi:hypothetical protein